MFFHTLIILFVAVLCISEALNTATIGPYSIEFDSSGLPRIKVLYLYPSGARDRVLWSTSPSVENELLVAERIQQTVTQIGGDYAIHENILDNCSKSDLEHFNADDKSVSIYGNLCKNHSFAITFTLQTHGHLGFNVTLHTNYFNKIKFSYGCDKDENFYGLGQQYSHIDFKGQSVPLFISEQGIGRGAQPVTLLFDYISPGSGGNSFTTYSRVPFYFTSHTRALHIDSLERAIVHFTKVDTIEIEINSTELCGRIITGNSSMDIIESFTAFSGRMKPLPNWVHDGAILGLQGGTQIVSGILAKVKEVMGSWEDIAAVWLQDWTGQKNITAKQDDLPRTGLWWNWEVDRQHYPKWEEFISELRSEGIRVTTYLNPLFSNVSNRGTPFTHDYYKEGLQAGYFIKSGPSKKVWLGYGDSCLVDLTNPKAYEWMVEMIINNVLSTNVSGWMCDFGESVPLDAVLFGGEDPVKYHTVYSEVWSQLNKDAVDKAVDRNIITNEQASEIVYFMRSGSTHSPSVTPLFWLGDQMVSWDHYDGLGSAIIGAVNSGLSGFTMTHSDIGGYTSLKEPIPFRYIRSELLLMRWCEFSAFTVVYRSHQGTLPDDNVQFYSNERTMKQYFRMARVHKAWKFYRDVLITEASKHGWPILRHLMLVFPGNPSVYTENLEYQYMLGTQILVAPVHEEWEEFVRVFLPSNVTWVSVWDKDTHYEGNNQWHYIQTPLGYPIALYPQGSSIGEQFATNLKKLLQH